MRNPQGYAVLQDVTATGNVLQEADTFTCFHCQRIVSVPPKADPAELGGLCARCMKLICPRCVETGRCRPWYEHMLKLERKMENNRLVSQIVGH